MSDETGATETSAPPDLLPLAAQIVSAHLRNHALSPEALPDLITSVYKALKDTRPKPAGASAHIPVPARREPAANPKKSLFPDYLVCLEDGKHLKTLKRHLQACHSLTPETYRERWGLAHDYPMTAPSYATRRSELAKTIGLERKTEPAPKAAPAALLKVQHIPEGVGSKKRGRPKKAG